MAAKTEGIHAGEFLSSEANGYRSRRTVTVKSGQNLGAGRVLGTITLGAITQAFSGTGNGTMTGLARAAAGCKVGDWKVRCIAAATDSGTFEVVDPDGIQHARATVGQAYSSGIAFTINDGSTDFTVGATFTVSVADGTYKKVAVDPTAVDGSQFASGILWDAVDASSADKAGVEIFCDAEVKNSALDWGSLTTDQKTAAKAQLAALGILVKEAN